MIEDHKEWPNLYLFCRICAMQCADLKNIFQKSNQIILDMLIENTDIKFLETDLLPKQICDMCISEVTSCHEFRLKSKKSDTILKDLFLNPKKENKDESILNEEKLGRNTHKENGPKLKTRDETPIILKKKKPTYKNISSGNSCHYHPEQMKVSLPTQKSMRKGIPPYKCLICGKSYVKLANLREHQSAHNGIKPFSCKICKRTFVTNRQLVVHTRIHTNLRPYLCSTCGEKFTHLSTFIAHNRIHTGDKPYECSQCNKAFHTASARMLHIKRNKCVLDKDKDKPNTLCYICGQVYSSQIALQNHIVKHTGQTTYKCHMCDKGFAREDHLKSHIRTHTGERPFVCSFCNKSFSQSGILQTHLALHNGKKFPCELCGKAFPRPAHLKRHKLIHSGESNFRCKFCDKQFTQKAHLSTHENTHLVDHSFKCSTCNLSFSQNVTLQKHILTHTGERPFLCHLCGISYTQTGRLASHMKKVHGTEKNCEVEDRPDELNLTLQSIFNQEEENVVLENITNPQTSNCPVLGNQTFELVTQSGQRFLATSLVLLPNQFNVGSENNFIQ